MFLSVQFSVMMLPAFLQFLYNIPCLVLSYVWYMLAMYIEEFTVSGSLLFIEAADRHNRERREILKKKKKKDGKLSVE